MKKVNKNQHNWDFYHNAEFLKKVIDSLQDHAIFTLDRQGRVTSWNAGAEKMLGYKEEEVLGKSYSIFFTEDEVKNKIPQQELNESELKNKTVNEGWRLRKNKKYFWATGFVSPLKDDQGKTFGYTKIMRDRTERQISQERLKEKERHHFDVISTLAEGILITDRNGVVQTANESAQKILGLSYEQLIGRVSPSSAWKVIGENGSEIQPDDRPTSIVLKTNKPLTNVIMGIYKLDGSIAWILVNATPLFKHGEHLPYEVVTSFMDITWRKTLEQQKDLFIGIASHELRTPITSLKLFADIMREQALHSGQQALVETADIIKEQIERIVKLVHGLLDFSKIQSGKLELNCQRFDINELISSTIKELQRTTKTHEFQYKNHTRKIVHADKERIGQVLTNLFTNAIKYSSRNSKIKVQLTVKENTITVAVQDFGIGIPKNEREKVFDRFFRTENAKHKNISGFGLGLYISSEIIKKHKGTITVKSKEGKGSTFYFTLPVNP